MALSGTLGALWLCLPIRSGHAQLPCLGERLDVMRCHIPKLQVWLITEQPETEQGWVCQWMSFELYLHLRSKGLLFLRCYHSHASHYNPDHSDPAVTLLFHLNKLNFIRLVITSRRLLFCSFHDNPSGHGDVGLHVYLLWLRMPLNTFRRFLSWFLGLSFPNLYSCFFFSFYLMTLAQIIPWSHDVGGALPTRCEALKETVNLVYAKFYPTEIKFWYRELNLSRFHFFFNWL